MFTLQVILPRVSNHTGPTQAPLLFPKEFELQEGGN
ncbi:Uncharacterised protein [Yersinia similis]|nr:Uncharacterised protein [Yersinia similis]